MPVSVYALGILISCLSFCQMQAQPENHNSSTTPTKAVISEDEDYSTTLSPIKPGGNLTYGDSQASESMCKEDFVEELKLTFPSTDIGAWALSEELCLDENYKPALRQCLRDATWGEVQGKCVDISMEMLQTTVDLYNMAKSDYINPGIAITSVVQEITKNISNLKPIDIRYVSEIIGNSGSSDENFFQIINDLLQVDKKILNASQELLNSTDRILYTLDKSLIAIQHNVTLSRFTAGNLVTSRLFFVNNSVNLLNAAVDEDFELAIVLKSEANIIYSIFQDDAFFNSGENNFSVESKIVDVLLPPGNEVEIYFKSFEESASCIYWKYGKDEDNMAIFGRWVIEGNASKLSKNFFKCKFNHTTHFALMMASSKSDSFVLSFITIFGSTLSLLGIAIIFVTAVLFKQWRKDSGHKIILNVVSCLMLFIILFLISDRVGEGLICIIVGALLHYIILVNLAWTTMICYSNYRRFIIEVLYQIDNKLFIYSLLSWGCPAIIVICVLSIDASTYQKTNTKNSICYPKSPYLEFGIMLPVGVISFTNLVIYIWIIKKLINRDFNGRKHVVKKSFSVSKSMFLMFFLMGLTWTFGILEFLSSQEIFSYLFCTAIAFQGFVLFLCYILDSKPTRKLWASKIGVVKNKQSETGKTNVGESEDDKSAKA